MTYFSLSCSLDARPSLTSLSVGVGLGGGADLPVVLAVSVPVPGLKLVDMLFTGGIFLFLK